MEVTDMDLKAHGILVGSEGIFPGEVRADLGTCRSRSSSSVPFCSFSNIMSRLES